MTYFLQSEVTRNTITIFQRYHAGPLQYKIQMVVLKHFRCLLYKHSNNADSFKILIAGRTHKIFRNRSCRTDNCIYLISCKGCSQRNVDETGDLRRRINNHRSTIKQSNKNQGARRLTFTSGHKWEDTTVMFIYHNSHLTDAERQSKEKF